MNKCGFLYKLVKSIKSSQIIVFNNKSSLNVYNTYASIQYRMMHSHLHKRLSYTYFPKKRKIIDVLLW